MLVLLGLVDVSPLNTFKVLFSFLKSVASANEHSCTIKNRVSTAAKVDGVTMFLFVQLDSNCGGTCRFMVIEVSTVYRKKRGKEFLVMVYEGVRSACVEKFILKREATTKV